MRELKETEMKKLLCLVLFSFFGCSRITSESISPEGVTRPGVRIVEERVTADGTADSLINSVVWLKIENSTASSFEAIIMCQWLDAGTEEEFAREAQSLYLGAFSRTSTWMQQYFFTSWRIRIYCEIVDLGPFARY